MSLCILIAHDNSSQTHFIFIQPSIILIFVTLRLLTCTFGKQNSTPPPGVDGEEEPVLKYPRLDLASGINNELLKSFLLLYVT